MYKIYFTKKAEKELDRLSSIDIKQTLAKIAKLKSPLISSLDIKKLVGVPGFYRLRSGKIRVIYEMDEDKKEIWIRKVGYRGSIYRT